MNLQYTYAHNKLQPQHTSPIWKHLQRGEKKKESKLLIHSSWNFTFPRMGRAENAPSLLGRDPGDETNLLCTDGKMYMTQKSCASLQVICISYI